MATVVIYDACVLHPAPLRDLLIRIAGAGLVQARWTDQILDECFRSILRRRPELEARLQRTRELMISAVPDCLIVGYRDLIESLTLPDPDDRHVLAAAIRAAAEIIVTSNVSDFPPEILARHDVEAKHPDDFVVDLIERAPVAVATIVARQAAELRSPPRTFLELLDTLQNTDLPLSAARLRELPEG